MRRFAILTTLVLGGLIFAADVPSAQACPTCKVANESGQESADANAVPRAYMYSILFMLSMPATLVTGFGIGFYRLWKKQQEMMQVQLPGDEGWIADDGRFDDTV
ncbi:hypothetical protein Mal4_07240 [Maioricimonas rarisocia]|uniref:Uncharacterized protein n=1 Tax=Maioricimonas rarisocia TaxID=2528026 RepID=A0A517Z1U9_9PLAN|nr:hypothetical protein [Maioricimonas rarisocia]QDU36438.1 hypothetical protein Mal4_07240 [Maioricimonas rarisocia]